MSMGVVPASRFRRASSGPPSALDSAPAFAPAHISDQHTLALVQATGARAHARARSQDVHARPALGPDASLAQSSPPFSPLVPRPPPRPSSDLGHYAPVHSAPIHARPPPLPALTESAPASSDLTRHARRTSTCSGRTPRGPRPSIESVSTVQSHSVSAPHAPSAAAATPRLSADLRPWSNASSASSYSVPQPSTAPTTPAAIPSAAPRPYDAVRPLPTAMDKRSDCTDRPRCLPTPLETPSSPAADSPRSLPVPHPLPSPTPDAALGRAAPASLPVQSAAIPSPPGPRATDGALPVSPVARQAVADDTSSVGGGGPERAETIASHSSLNSGGSTPVRGSPLLGPSMGVSDLVGDPDEIVRRHGFGVAGLGMSLDAPSAVEVDGLVDELEALRAPRTSVSDAQRMYGASRDRDDLSGLSEEDEQDSVHELDEDVGPSVSDNEGEGTWSDDDGDGTSTLVGSSYTFTSALPNQRRSMRASRASRSSRRSYHHRRSTNRPRSTRRPSLSPGPTAAAASTSASGAGPAPRSASRPPLSVSRGRATGNTPLAPIASVTHLPAPTPEQPQRVRLRDRLRNPASLGFYGSSTALHRSAHAHGSTGTGAGGGSSSGAMRSTSSLLGFSLRPTTSRPLPPAANHSLGVQHEQVAEEEEALARTASFDSLLSDASTLNEQRRRMGVVAAASAPRRRPGEPAPAPPARLVPRGPRLPWGRSTPNLLVPPRGPGGPGNHLFPSTSRPTPNPTSTSATRTRTRPTTAPSSGSTGNPLFPPSAPAPAPGAARAPPPPKKRGKFRAGFRRLFSHSLSATAH